MSPTSTLELAASPWPCSYALCCAAVGFCRSFPTVSSTSISNSSKLAFIRSIENEEMLSSFVMSTLERSVSYNSAKELIERITSFNARSSSFVTRSTLLSRMRSANATWHTASLTASSAFFSSRCAVTCFESTRHTMPSTLKLLAITGFCVKVETTGAGLATPVVSSSTMSNSLLRSFSCVSAFNKSPRTVQQAQPLSNEIISSATFMFSLTKDVSMSTEPNSFSMTQTRTPCFSVRMWLISVVLPAPKKPVITVIGSLSLSSISSMNSSSAKPITAGSSASWRITRSTSAGAKIILLPSSSFTWYGTHMPSGKEDWT